MECVPRFTVKQMRGAYDKQFYVDFSGTSGLFST